MHCGLLEVQEAALHEHLSRADRLLDPRSGLARVHFHVDQVVTQQVIRVPPVTRVAVVLTVCSDALRFGSERELDQVSDKSVPFVFSNDVLEWSRDRQPGVVVVLGLCGVADLRGGSLLVRRVIAQHPSRRGGSVDPQALHRDEAIRKAQVRLDRGVVVRAGLVLQLQRSLQRDEIVGRP